MWLPLSAQLIPNGQPVPRAAKLPVVFLNGYQNDCSSATFAKTFGSADQALQANGEASLFFNNCSIPGNPAIETLGAAFGAFLSDLRYDDGQPVDVVDVVAHSMGGLIVRSYLSGKQTAPGTFDPPPATHIRKAVFMATPHFGTGIALGLGFTAQLQELSSGSRFLFDLATWNQGTDDLRGVDALAIIGNGGTGQATMPGFDDGVVALTSASLRFYMPGRTQVVPYCHVNGGGLVSFGGFCPGSAAGIADVKSAAQDTARILLSFLNGTEEWRGIGTPAEQDPFLAVDAGLYVMERTADDNLAPLDSVAAKAPSGQSKKLNLPTREVAYTDLFPAGADTIAATSGSLTVAETLDVPPGGVDPITLKPGPFIARVLPSAARLFPLAVAPGELVSLYGTALAGDAQTAVLLNGAALQVLYVSPAQINAVIPAGVSGLVKITARNGAGAHTVNVLIAPAAPAIFTQDGSGAGAAAALNAANNALVTPASPLRAGDYVELFATGLGDTSRRGGLDFASQPVSVTVAGVDCPVTFAGRAPGFTGLDQIDCRIPSGLAPNAAAAVVIFANGRASNAATLAVQ